MTRTSLTLLALVALAGTAQAQVVSPPVDEKPAAEPPPSEPPAPKPAPAPAAAPAAAPAPAPPPAAYSPWITAPAGAPAAPASPVADAEPEAPLPPAGPPGWQAWLGVRTSFFTGTGYDPFSANDTFVAGSVGASRRLLTSDKLSVAAALGFDFGTARENARGEATTLSTWRVTLGPEARYHLLPTLYAFVRPSAGVQRSVATLEEGSTGASLAAKDWLLAVDGSAGAAWSFLDLRKQNLDLMFWLVADGGYGFTQSSDLLLEPESDSSAPERTAALNLGELSASGPFFRIALAGTF